MLALYLSVVKLMVKLQNRHSKRHCERGTSEAISSDDTSKNHPPACADSLRIPLRTRAIPPRKGDDSVIGISAHWLIISSLCFFSFTLFAQQDVTLHKVIKGETLYSLCKRYQVDMTDVIVLNNMGNSGYSLALGQTLKIPAAKKPVYLADLKAARVADDGYITHVVKQGETLYSICRSYNGVTVPMLREKNNLKSDTLAISQKLIIPQELNVKSAYKDVKKAPAQQKMPLEKQFLAAEKTTETADISRGVATWIQGEGENMKNYYALHKTTPLGTVIKVRNLMNNRTTYVKVVGKLPDTEEYKSTTIKLSGAAAYALQVLDAKFLVELTMPQTAKAVDESRK